MELSEYQELAAKTAVYNNALYPYLALSEEVGEVNALVAKQLRKVGYFKPDEIEEKLIDELGDVLWNVAMAARDLGYTLDDVAQLNLQKLSERLDEGTLYSRDRSVERTSACKFKSGDLVVRVGESFDKVRVGERYIVDFVRKPSKGDNLPSLVLRDVFGNLIDGDFGYSIDCFEFSKIGD